MTVLTKLNRNCLPETALSPTPSEGHHLLQIRETVQSDSS